jgi:hypothetical protein
MQIVLTEAELPIFEILINTGLSDEQAVRAVMSMTDEIEVIDVSELEEEDFEDPAEPEEEVFDFPLKPSQKENGSGESDS